MAATVTYTTVNGEILHENRGGVEGFYVPDPLGNTSMLVNSSGTVTDTWNYWPYGEVQEHGGSSETPFTYVGTRGCHADPSGSIYMRAREFEPELTNWITVDLFWPEIEEQAYGYGGRLPTVRHDPTGLSPTAQKPLMYPPSGSCTRFGKVWTWAPNNDNADCFAFACNNPFGNGYPYGHWHPSQHAGRPAEACAELDHELTHPMPPNKVWTPLKPPSGSCPHSQTKICAFVNKGQGTFHFVVFTHGNYWQKLPSTPPNCCAYPGAPNYISAWDAANNGPRVGNGGRTPFNYFCGCYCALYVFG